MDINEVSVFAVIANPNPRTLTQTLKRTGFIHDELPRGTGNVGSLQDFTSYSSICTCRTRGECGSMKEAAVRQGVKTCLGLCSGN